MKITDIRTVQLTRTLARPLRNSKAARNKRSFTFVVVETDSNITGLGDAFGDEVLMEFIVERRLKPMAVGLDPCDIQTLWDKLYAGRAFWEVGGSVVVGISALEVACWDIRGKVEKVPVSELLGGAQRDWVEAYASDLYWDDPESMANLAKNYVNAGFRWVKTHIGAEPDRDLIRLETMRRAIGPKIGLMIDLNTGFDRQTALEQGRRQAAFDPFWLEEPIPPMDYEGHAWLRKQLPMPIATGENLYTTYGFEPMFAVKGCDYIMPDILRCGGLQQTKLICESAKRHGVIATPHNFSSGVGLAATLHLMAAMPDTQMLELDTTETAIYEELFTEPLLVKEGRVRVPTGPGLGVRLTDEIVARYK